MAEPSIDSVEFQRKSAIKALRSAEKFVVIVHHENDVAEHIVCHDGSGQDFIALAASVAVVADRMVESLVQDGIPALSAILLVADAAQEIKDGHMDGSQN